MGTDRLRSLGYIFGFIVLALATACSVAGCSGYQASAWKDTSGAWIRWTPPNGDWRQAKINVWCPAGTAYCLEAQSAFSEWSNESIQSNQVMFDSSQSTYVGRLNWSDIDYEIQDFGPTGWVGLAQLDTCVPSGSKAGCRSARAYTNLFQGYQAAQSSFARRAIACQEIGHIFGLDHANGDCMGYTYEDLLGTNTSDQLERHSTEGVAALRYVASLCKC